MSTGTIKDWGGRVVPYPPAQAHPDRTAVVALDGGLTYRELDERTDALAAGLVGLGLVPGDPVLFQVTNRLEAIVAWYGVLKAGLIPVCTLAAHRGHEIGEISRRVGAVAHLVDDASHRFDIVGFAVEQQHDHPTLRHVLVLGTDDRGVTLESLAAGIDPETAREAVEQAQQATGPDEVAVFQLSGGTTGVPKVIPRLHAEYWYNAAQYARSWGWGPDSRIAHLIPIIHNAGIVCALHAAHSVGALLILAVPDLHASLPLLTEHGVTHILLGQSHYAGFDSPGFAAAARTLKEVVLSGAKVPPPIFDALERRGLWSGQLFGMGEGLLATTRPGAPRHARATTVGTRISPLDEVRVLEPGTEDELPDGQVGELCCRGPYCSLTTSPRRMACSCRMPMVATSARACPTARSTGGSAPGLVWNRFSAPIARPRSRRGSACTDRKAPRSATAAVNSGHRAVASVRSARSPQRRCGSSRGRGPGRSAAA